MSLGFDYVSEINFRCAFCEAWQRRHSETKTGLFSALYAAVIGLISKLKEARE